MTDNYQVVTVDQSSSSQTLTRTSTVTVKDSTAEYGYSLMAKIANNTIPGGTATIGSASSTTCPLATPCTLPSDNSSIPIISTDNDNAVQTSGDTTEWQVRITLPANTAIGNYVLDVEYDESRLRGVTDITYMQDLATVGNELLCANTTDRTRTVLIDRRNNQPYYVEKVAGLCWMESNLRYAGNGSWNSSWGYSDDRYATTATLGASTANPNDNSRPLTLIAGTTESSYTAAQYANPGGSSTYTDTRANGGFYGYLYNWCSAMGGQPRSCNDTSTSGFNTTVSICPAGWRLPTGRYATINEYEVLNNAINGGNTDTDKGLRDNWLLVYSGDYRSGLRSQGSSGRYSSSNAEPSITDMSFAAVFDGSNVDPGTNNFYKKVGLAVRCVRE